MTSILFDLDGTLVDSSPGIFKAFNYAFEHMKLPQPNHEELIGFIGPPLETTFAQVLNRSEDIEKAIKHFRDYYNQHGVHQAKAYEGISQALDKLVKQGHSLYVTTSKHEAMAKLMLAEQDLTSFFTGIYGSKPNCYHKVDVIKACLNDNDIPEHQAIIIGDTKFDMIGGKEAKIRTLGVTWGFGKKEDLLNNGAEQICQQPLELVNVFTVN